MYSSIDTCTMTNQEVNQEADIQTLVKQIFKKSKKLQKSLSKPPYKEIEDESVKGRRGCALLQQQY